MTVTANLGLPFLHQAVALAVLMVIAGYCLASAVHRRSSSDSWKLPLLLSMAGRAVPATLLVVTLTGLYGLIKDGGLAGSESLALLSATTFTGNIVPFLTDAFYLPVEHLWALALLAQVAVAAPFLLTFKARQVDRRHRAWGLLGAAVALALVRMVMAARTGEAIWINPTPHTWTGFVARWTMADGLLVGMAVGTMPLASLHRRPTTKAVTPALFGLGVLVAVPSFAGTDLDVVLRIPRAIVAASAVLAAAAIFSLPPYLDRIVSSDVLHRIGSRSVGLYLWHIPFAYGVSRGDPFIWHGSLVFVIVVVLSLAAATITYRSIELPAQATLRWLVRRWFPSEAIVLTSPAPQRDKWRRWDEISLDSLPKPVRRRSHSTPAGRLWQHGDRVVIDGDDSPAGAGEAPAI